MVIQMKKVYKKLTTIEKESGFIFSSSLSNGRTEDFDGTIHKVHYLDIDKDDQIRKLKDDSFFNNSPFNFNIIRT